MNFREKIYEVRDRGDYRQFWIPKRQPTKEEKIAKGQRNFVSLFIDYTTTPLKLLESEIRSYFLLQNLDAAASAFLGLGFVPDVVSKRGVLIPSEQAYEPLMVPQNEVWIVGSASGKAILIYSVD